MLLTLSRDNRVDTNVTFAQALERGYSAAQIGQAAKARALELVAQNADAYRARISTLSAARVAEWFMKEEIARDPDNADPEELAIIEQEGAADGTDLDGMLAVILTKAKAFRKVALLVGKIEAEAKAAVRGIDDAADDIEAQIDTALTAAKAEAETAFQAAVAAMNGG